MIGRVLLHYEVVGKLGEGGMGVVYKARDKELGRLVAIKVLSGDAGLDESRRKRFLQEARTASALNHPNIVTIYDIGHADGFDFIVMEFVEGEALKNRIGGGLPAREAAGLGRQIAGALCAAHSTGIVHRDIKPANILVTPAGTVKVLDFGLAKLTGHASLSDTDPTLTGGGTVDMTERGAVLGTAAYMSPEQAEGRSIDPKSDVFSLGVVLYEMLSGRKPFHGDTSLATMMAIVRDAAPPLTGAPDDLVRLAGLAMQKNRDARCTAAELERGLADYLDSLSVRRHPAGEWVKRPRLVAPVLAALLAAAGGGYWYHQSGAKYRWARDQAATEISRLVEQGKYFPAFDLATEAEKQIPNHPGLAKLWQDFTQNVEVETDPSGADVSYQELGVANAPWRSAGKSPLHGFRLPSGFLRWKAVKDGFDPALSFPPPILVLSPRAETPRGMVAVSAAVVNYSVFGLGIVGPVAVKRYYMDQFEVTNRQFKEFVENGGYQKREYWKFPFRKANRTLAWEEAMAEFRDSSGRPGPSTWEAGSYRGGEEEFPVGGVSWYEAAAYAQFAGKHLPTIYHWYRSGDPRAAAYVATSANFNGKGPVRVGSDTAGVTAFGAFDMAGNVKEWCWNETDDGLRFILGGGWNEPPYYFTNPDARSPFDRSPSNGFRCVRYPEPPPELTLAPRGREFRDYSKEKPVSSDTFRVIRGIYAAERGALDPKMESADSGFADWRVEKVSYRAAYGNQRVPAYLFLPKKASPPFQTVVYFPGGGAVNTLTSKILEVNRFDFIIRSGRAVLYPVYSGTYERRNPAGFDYYRPLRPILVQQFQDLVRSVDYLESRPDIDPKRLAYGGVSMGARLAPMMLSMENRFQAAVLFDGGFHLTSKPTEVDESTFAPYAKTPVLMINGRYDYTFPFEASQKPFFRHRRNTNVTWCWKLRTT
ncbi:MAG: protein kinase [Acidobacteria bacterium]|nr:protein kinase [Acidobacteriota bacterium]